MKGVLIMDDYNKHNDEFENIGENNENFYGNEGYLEERKEEYDEIKNYDEIENYDHYNTEKHLKESSFYSESYSKPKKKKNPVLMQMVIVAIISSLLGGVV